MEREGQATEDRQAPLDVGTAAPSGTMRIDRQGSRWRATPMRRPADALMRGEFVAGTKLTLRSLSEALGVSTTPARDAVNRMIGEGALANLGPKTVVVPVLTKPALDEVTAIRLLLEGLASERGRQIFPRSTSIGWRSCRTRSTPRSTRPATTTPCASTRNFTS